MGCWGGRRETSELSLQNLEVRRQFEMVSQSVVPQKGFERDARHVNDEASSKKLV
jgi:hypothetical protein